VARGCGAEEATRLALEKAAREERDPAARERLTDHRAACDGTP